MSYPNGWSSYKTGLRVALTESMEIIDSDDDIPVAVMVCIKVLFARL
jgi:hypothetical protein